MDQSPADSALALQEGQRLIRENQRGVSFDALLGPYLHGAQRITVTDPYIRQFYQAKNLMELMETIVKQKEEDDEIEVHLITTEDEMWPEKQADYLDRIQTACGVVGIHFSWEFAENGSIHARHIVTDHGWKILLDRGLDVFQRYDAGDTFSFAGCLQQYRACKAFEVTFLRTNS